MVKANTDYVAKHKRLDTLKIISKFKNKLANYFIKEFDLFEVDPKYITNINENFTEKRNVTFDNFENNKIYEVSPFINNELLRYINELNLPVKSGVYSYAAIFNRDFGHKLNETTHEFAFFVYIKDYLSEMNESNMTQIVAKICNYINALVDELGSKLKKLPGKIHVTSVDKLIRSYPIISTDQLINYANTNNHLMLVSGVNGCNQRHYSFIDSKLSAFGKYTASLYVFSSVNNVTLKILTISIAPSVSELEEIITDRKLNTNEFGYARSTLNEENNCIGFELYVSQLMMYIMQKYSINEVVATDNETENDKKYRNNFLL